MQSDLRTRWRPSLWYVVILVLGLVICLPFAGLFLFKFYANQLVQQTEESLIGQASVMSATYAELYKANTDESYTPNITGARSAKFAPILPSISLGEDKILPPRGEPEEVTTPPDQIYLDIGRQLTAISNEAQQSTLVGYRILDPLGNVVGGSAEVGMSLASVGEVRAALDGNTVSVPRVRVRDKPEPIIYQLATGTKLRVFVAMPVFVQGKVVGAVYLSRTPNHIFHFLYGERYNLLKAAIFVLIATSLIGFVFWRFITRPIYALIDRTKSIGASEKAKWEPVSHFGTKEIENLSRSFESMTNALQNRQEAINTFTAHVTHELKSPITSVQGAAELLRDANNDMSVEQRKKFLDNIVGDTTRMVDLLKSMQEFAQSEQPLPAGKCCLEDLQADLTQLFPKIDIRLENSAIEMPIHQKALIIILKHLLENSMQHGADTAVLLAGNDTLTISDNGQGISAGNREKIFAPFFTTRREAGGTGMGLSIVASMLETIGGKIEVGSHTQGAEFKVQFGK